MQKVDLAELRRLHEAATKGDWVADYESKVGTRCILKGDAIQTFPMPAADAVFIAAAHNALPALLDELERLRSNLKTATATIRIMEQSIKDLESAIGKELGVPQGEAVWKWLLKRDRRMKAIGAAEWLEANNERLDTMNRSDVEEVAAQLRREAEDGK